MDAALRALSVSTLAALVAAALLTATSARAHPTGTHTGFQSTVSYIEPQLPGLLVRVLGGHEQLSVENLTQKSVVILDEQGRPVVRIPPGRTRIWPEPRIGSAEATPEREGLVRNWRIPGTADGRPFAIVGFLGYRPPASEANDGGVPMWAIATAAGASVLILAAALALPFLRREGEGEQQAASRRAASTCWVWNSRRIAPRLRTKMQAIRFNHASMHATADALQATLYLEKAEL